MFVCLNCNREFSSPKRIVESSRFGLSEEEEYVCCPYCHGDFEPVNTCFWCGDIIEGDVIELQNGRTYCEECYKYCSRNLED